MKRYGRPVALLGLYLTMAAAILRPIVWAILLSLKARVDALSWPPRLIVFPTLDNYRSAFIDGPYGQTIINSIVIASASSCLAIILGVPAAYALSRFRIPGRKQ